MSIYTQVLLDNPTSYWPMDEASGSVRDLAGNDHPATVVNGGIYGQRIGGLSAIDLDGTNDYLGFANHAFNGTNSTLEIWFIPDNVAGQPVIFGKDGDGDTYVILNSSTSINVQTDSPGTVVSFTVPTISNGSIYHLVVTRSSNITRLYLNGVESSSGGLSQSASMIVNQIGRYSSGGLGLFFDGRVGHAAIWESSALSLERIKSHYNAGIRAGVVIG